MLLYKWKVQTDPIMTKFLQPLSAELSEDLLKRWLRLSGSVNGVKGSKKPILLGFSAGIKESNGCSRPSPTAGDDILGSP